LKTFIFPDFDDDSLESDIDNSMEIDLQKTTAASAMDPTVLHVLNKKLGNIN
jgi:hypothetical protein